jgi:hypothetical protein
MVEVLYQLENQYGRIPHDEYLATVCNGLRPTVDKGTPKCYIDLANQCLDANPGKRPSSKEILEVIRNWRFHNEYEKILHSREKSGYSNGEMIKEFIDADIKADKDKSELSSTETMLHPKAIYSRLMKFNSLCEPKNSIGYLFGY